MDSEGMEFQDREIVCTDCESSFDFSAAEQLFYHSKNLNHSPKRCKPCRARLKGKQLVQRNHRIPVTEACFRQPMETSHTYPAASAPVVPKGIGGAPLFKADFGPSPWQGGEGKRSRGDDRQRARSKHEAVCDECSVTTHVPFRPNGVQPVYCRVCMSERRQRRRRNRVARPAERPQA